MKNITFDRIQRKGMRRRSPRVHTFAQQQARQQFAQRDSARFGRAYRGTSLDQVVWRRVTRADWFSEVGGPRHA